MNASDDDDDSAAARKDPINSERPESDYAQIADVVVSLRGRELRGFAPPIAPEAPSPGRPHKYRFASKVVSLVDVLDLLLATIPARRLQTFERFGWEYEFEYEQIPCALRWTKSGVRLTLWLPPPDGPRADATASVIEKRLTRAATTVYRKALLPRVIHEVEQNKVMVINQYARYRGMVDYFLQQLLRVRDAAPQPRPSKAQRGLASVFAHEASPAQVETQRSHELAYLATALVAAYFAYIQHALVVLGAFSPRALDSGFSLSNLLGAKWSEQFDTAFPPPHYGGIGAAKSDLAILAQNYRNPLLHGGGGRPADGMFVSWAPGRSILATEDGDPTAQFMLWQASLNTKEIDDILSRIERVDLVFREHPFFSWLSSGLAADFHQDAIQSALAAIQDGVTEAFVNAANDSFDDQVNWV